VNTFLPTLITWLQEYGYPALWFTICIAAIGLPLPIGLLLLGSGALAAFGDFNLWVLLVLSTSAAVAGDSTGYLLGRRYGSKLFGWLEHQQRFRFIKPEVVTRSRLYFQKRGGWAVLLSRFLFSAFGSPINLLAGAELYPYRHFLLYDAIGEAIGISIPLVVGFGFSASWEEAGEIMSTVTLLILALLITIYLTVYLIMLMKRMRNRKRRQARSAEGEQSKPASPMGFRTLDFSKEGGDTLPL
jgi:membrane-associated protein